MFQIMLLAPQVSRQLMEQGPRHPAWTWGAWHGRSRTGLVRGVQARGSPRAQNWSAVGSSHHRPESRGLWGRHGNVGERAPLGLQHTVVPSEAQVPSVTAAWLRNYPPDTMGAGFPGRVLICAVTCTVRCR